MNTTTDTPTRTTITRLGGRNGGTARVYLHSGRAARGKTPEGELTTVELTFAEGVWFYSVGGRRLGWLASAAKVWGEL